MQIFMQIYISKRNFIRNIIISKLLNIVRFLKLLLKMIKNTLIFIYKYLITIKKIIFVSNKLLLYPKLIHYTF